MRQESLENGCLVAEFPCFIITNGATINTLWYKRQWRHSINFMILLKYIFFIYLLLHTTSEGLNPGPENSNPILIMSVTRCVKHLSQAATVIMIHFSGKSVRHAIVLNYVIFLVSRYATKTTRSIFIRSVPMFEVACWAGEWMQKMAWLAEMPYVLDARVGSSSR